MIRCHQSEWLALIQEFEQSGLSQTAFCAKRDLNAKYFSLRRTKLLATRQSSAFMAAAFPQSGTATLHYGKVSLRLPVQEEMTLSPIERALFVYCNRRR